MIDSKPDNGGFDSSDIEQVVYRLGKLWEAYQEADDNSFIAYLLNNSIRADQFHTDMSVAYALYDLKIVKPQPTDS